MSIESKNPEAPKAVNTTEAGRRRSEVVGLHGRVRKALRHMHFERLLSSFFNQVSPRIFKVK